LYPKDNYTIMMEATKLIDQKRKRRAAIILDEDEEEPEVS
jgi:hypothetical protein